MNEKKVYISYAGKSDTIYKYAEHKVEYTQDDRQRDSIVDDLTSAFDLADIELVKDTENVVIGSGNITKFEREIGDAQYVIVVLCDKYFLSPHCMYEWDMIHQNTDNKLICYVYFADEKIIYADGELDGRSMPIKDKYADYYPLIRKTWQNWHKNLVGQHRKEIFALSDVETYACNKNLDDIYNVNEDNPYLYSQSFTVISSILKNSSVVRGAQTTNFKKNAATIIAKEFKKSFDDNIKKSFGLNIDESNKITKEFELRYSAGRDVNVNSTQTNIGIQIINNYNGANLPSSNGSNNVVSPSVKTVHTILGDFLIDYNGFEKNDFDYRPSDVTCYGRKTIIEDIHNRFKNESFLWNIVATGGSGKTFFAHRYKEFFSDEYDIICHIYLNKNIKEEFVDNMTRFIKNSTLREKMKSSNESLDVKIGTILDILERVEENVFFVLDINAIDREQFDPEFVNTLLNRLCTGNWHILILSRVSFQKNVYYLPGFEDEPDTAVQMFCDIYRKISNVQEDIWNAQRLKDIFRTPTFNFHPLLISVLASYCGRERITDFEKVEDIFEEVGSEELPTDMGKREGQVMLYLKKLISFDSYGPECEILLRHFILWDYNNIHYEVIAKFLSKYPIKSFRKYLNDLVNDMILTRSEHEYRINGLTVKEQCAIEYHNSNRDEDWHYEDEKDAEFRDKLEKKYGKLDDIPGYRLHGMIGQVLRLKAKQSPFDYSNYLSLVREQLECMESVNIFRSLQLNMYESLYEHNDILNPSDDFFLLALAHYYYFNGEYKWKNIKRKALDVIDTFSVNYEDCYDKLDNMAMSIHDAAFVLNNLGEDKDVVINFLKKSIEIREHFFEKKLRDEESDDNMTKFAFECYVISYLESGWDWSRKASSIMEELIDKHDTEDLKARYYQMIVVYNRMAEEQGISFNNEWVIKRFNSVIFDSKIKDNIERYFYNDLSKVNNSFCPELLLLNVIGGRFPMGSKDGYDDEQPVHDVDVPNFMIGKYPVTQIQWDYVMGGKIPSFFRVDYHRGLGPNYPMYNITWKEAVQFCNRLSNLMGMEEVYTLVYNNNDYITEVKIDRTKNGYRLLTEAEWEYAARGGQDSKGYIFSGCNDIEQCSQEEQVAWFDNNSKGSTHPVGLLKPNELGLYDMSGNVWEWCQDVYDSGFYKKCNDDTNLQSDPCNEGDSGSARVLRGGSWSDSARSCRVSGRNYALPDFRRNDIGFRLSLSPQK